MIIKTVAIGNKNEAFVERRLQPGLNILSSDDNNKGKTIVIQSIMYAFGNEPTFPTNFDYKNYYYYVEFEVSKVIYCLCRYNNGFVLKHNKTLILFDSVSELKRYWNKYIFHLPSIIKNQVSRIVDPVLFLQMFFVGQDKKDTSNISHSGFYNKADFYNMIFDVCNLSGLELDETEIIKIKKELEKLKNNRALLIKQHTILKEQKTPISFLSSVNDRAVFGQKLQELEKINTTITELRKARNTAATRKASWESTLKELYSLNRTIECGQLRCMDCNSTNIAFSSSNKKAYAFDVSSKEMRDEIITSINGKIESYAEEITRLSSQISAEQDDMKTLMDDDAISLEAIVAYKQDIFCASDAEKKINEIDGKIETLENRLKMNTATTLSKREGQYALLASITNEMNSIYKTIDPDGHLQFDDLFSKRDQVYSGSDQIVFHLSRLYALSKTIHHSYPIVVDSFRAEDLSTTKENAVIDVFKQLPNQVIFTTTLKMEEAGKYDTLKDIHHIDYTNHTPSKLLSEKPVEDFCLLLESMSITIRESGQQIHKSEDEEKA